MKNEIRQTTKVTSRIALKTKLMWIVAGISALSLAGLLALFFYFYVGNPLKTIANGGYQSFQSGDWIASSTWNSAPPSTSGISDSDITISSGHWVTYSGSLSFQNNTTLTVESGATLLIDGDILVNNDLVLVVYGKLSVSGEIVANNGTTLKVTAEGIVEIGENADFGNNASFVIDGTLSIGGNITFGNNPGFNGEGTIEVGGSGCSYWDGTGACRENTTLPVELLSFDAKVDGDRVTVKWKTASELNNDFFLIQRSENGVDFKTIAVAKGNGTTREISEYEFSDEQPVRGLSYYRLVQTDYDGTQETFRPVSVAFNATSQDFSIYPNPLSGNNVYVTLHDNASEGSLQISNANGEIIYSQHVAPPADNHLELVLDQNLKKGTYFVHYKSKSFQRSVKLVKL